MQLKKVLAVSALSGIALGANNSTLTTATPSVSKACSFSDFTATKSDQVAQVAACATAVGDITIQGPAFGSVELTGVKQIYGNLAVKNANLTVILNAPTLQLVSGELLLEQDTILATLNLAQLTTVGTLTLNALPALQKTGLTAGITSAEEIVISDTGLTSLDGINVYKLKKFDVNNNGDIESIDSGLQSVTDTLSITYNAEKVDVSLDELTSANSVNFQSINSLSAANLSEITGSLAISQSSIDKIEFKNLESIGKSLTIDSNDELEELDFPKVTSIGGALQVTDNSQLKSFDGFPKLKTVGGSVTINGTFDNGTFESLQRVAGGFNLQTDGELSCKEFNQLNKDGDIKGDKYYCSGASGNTSSSSSKKANKDSSSTATDSSSASASATSSSSSTSSSTTRQSGASSNGAAAKLATVVASFLAFGVALY